ncbi:hypothetical protein M3Y94_00712400 [Aphelenchoides besseyi]|nr:hypothetical protein M3Y94_00712400 [Aphelenchoides besseyi]
MEVLTVQQLAVHADIIPDMAMGTTVVQPSVVVRNEYQDTTYTPAFSPYAQQQFVQQPYVQPTPQELVMVKPKSTRTDTDSKVQSDAVKTSVQKNNSEVSVEPKMPTVDAPKAKTQKATTNVSVAQPQKQAKMNFLDPGMDFLKH